MLPSKRMAFEEGIRHLINSLSLESESNTPDYILAAYLVRCFETFTETTVTREDWHSCNRALCDNQSSTLCVAEQTPNPTDEA